MITVAPLVTRDRNQIQTSSRKQQQHRGLRGKVEERFRAWSGLSPWIQVPHPCPVLDPASFCVASPSEHLSSTRREDASLKSQVSTVFWAYNRLIPRSILIGPSWLPWTIHWVKWDCMLPSRAHWCSGAPWLTPPLESPSVGSDICECHPQRKSTTIHVHCTHFRK